MITIKIIPESLASFLAGLRLVFSAWLQSKWYQNLSSVPWPDCVWSLVHDYNDYNPNGTRISRQLPGRIVFGRSVHDCNQNGPRISRQLRGRIVFGF